MKQNDEHIAALKNQAKWTGETELPQSHQRDEIIGFTLQDNFHTFTLPLGTILEILKFAERIGYIPPIPAEWWVLMKDIHPTPSSSA